MIVIIDYGMGNLRSVQKAFERIRVPVRISADSKEILNAEKLVLPGVGHFEKGMSNLKQNGLLESINEAVQEKSKPVLGICLGMQLMTNKSEEGNCEGLGWIDAETKKFTFNSSSMKIPHMGWNNLHFTENTLLLKNITPESFFYFVHSYYVSCNNENEVLTETIYGKSFVSSFGKENIWGCQFHPEKSHEAGLKILKNFSDL